MRDEVFFAGLRLCEECEYGVFLGGGEPTDHPKFTEYLVALLGADLALEFCGVITSGTNDKEARILSNVRDVIYTCLSLDKYHFGSMVSDQVRNLKFTDIRREVRVQQIGRGKSIPGAGDNCTCPELWLDYNGNLYQCGCKKRKIGNILEADIDQCLRSNTGGCSRETDE